MPLTLWRGDQLLGELNPRDAYVDPEQAPYEHDAFAAILIPTDDARDLGGMWQIAMPPEFGVGVQQRQVEVDVVAERAERMQSSARRRVGQEADHGFVALEPMSAEAIAGVPPDVQLTVRTTDGKVFLPRQIHVQQMCFGPPETAVIPRGVPFAAVIDGSVWYVHIDFDPGNDSVAG